jgi:uncharacterized membrane protein
MNPAAPQPETCQICGRGGGQGELIPASVVRATVAAGIRHAFPQWNNEGFICSADLNRFRERYVRSLLESEQREITDLENEVVHSLQQHEILASNPAVEFERDLTLAQRGADFVARIGGSWLFIAGFAAFMAVWIIANTVWLAQPAFDPYPYILLNLILSCLAAIQAPIIMMSQNRQEAKDRARAEHDYQINLKAELEIRHLHEKVDHLLRQQWERLAEIQEIQLELMRELTAGMKRRSGE